MRKLNVFSVTLVIQGRYRWDRRFVGRPNVEEVIEALQIDKVNGEVKKYDALLELVGRFGLPLDLNTDKRSEYIGVKVGSVRLSTCDPIFLPERVEGGLEMFETPCQAE